MNGEPWTYPAFHEQAYEDARCVGSSEGTAASAEAERRFRLTMQSSLLQLQAPAFLMCCGELSFSDWMGRLPTCDAGWVTQRFGCSLEPADRFALKLVQAGFPPVHLDTELPNYCDDMHYTMWVGNLSIWTVVMAGDVDSKKPAELKATRMLARVWEENHLPPPNEGELLKLLKMADQVLSECRGGGRQELSTLSRLLSDAPSKTLYDTLKNV